MAVACCCCSLLIIVCITMIFAILWADKRYFCSVMPQKPKKKLKTTSRHKKRASRRKYWQYWLLGIMILAMLGTGFYLRQTIRYYYALLFDRFEHRTLHNNKREAARIEKIIRNNAEKTFGLDISHYQNLRDIRWDSLAIGNRTIPLQFVLLRATMGTRSKDRNFDTFWLRARKHGLIRGGYHFYRADEDPVRQANNFLGKVQLEDGDLLPVLDIEKPPLRLSREQFIENIKVWCRIAEAEYGAKPIIYTYYHFYRDYLAEDFEDYPLWLANYNAVPAPRPEGRWDFWQFTENGIVYGINTKVDLDIYNGSISQLKELTVQNEK